MVFENVSSGDVDLATGTIDAERSDDIIEFKGHMWIGPSKDGGISDFIRSINDVPADRWLAAPDLSDKAKQGWRSDNLDCVAEAEAAYVPLHCHCKRVELRIARATEEAKSINNPRKPPDWPDFIVPARSGRDIKNEHGFPWWLSEDYKRYSAATCLCESCRLGTGFDIMSWCFIPIKSIAFPDGSALEGSDYGLESDERIAKMLSMYKSKILEGVKRYFCPSCGASVLWFNPDRPKLLDVSTALLDAPSGVRAASFLEWHIDRIGYREEALHRGLMEALEKGSQQWKLEQDANVEA